MGRMYASVLLKPEMGNHMSFSPKMIWRRMAIQKEGAAMPKVEKNMMILSAGLPLAMAANTPSRMPQKEEKRITMPPMTAVTLNPLSNISPTGFLAK